MLSGSVAGGAAVFASAAGAGIVAADGELSFGVEEFKSRRV
jgi:hypothetical protein